MANKLMIPMIVLAKHFKESENVPSVTPNYKNALSSYLGKDSTPAAFNINALLKKRVHLHFVLPTFLKRGTETTNANGEKTFAIHVCFLAKLAGLIFQLRNLPYWVK